MSKIKVGDTVAVKFVEPGDDFRFGTVTDINPFGNDPDAVEVSFDREQSGDNPGCLCIKASDLEVVIK